MHFPRNFVPCTKFTRMGFVFAFERLNVWHDAMKMTALIYRHTETFPRFEYYSLRDQIRRASVSVASNIAEGSGRISRKDQAHFFQLAYSSLMELLNQIMISKELGYLNEESVLEIRCEIEKVSNKLNALRRHSLQSIK